MTGLYMLRNLPTDEEWAASWDANVDFWGDVFNPLGYWDLAVDPTWDKAKEQMFHFGIKSALLTTAAAGVWALSGGGASMGMWFGASPPTAGRMMALKASGYKEVAQWMYTHRAALARGIGWGIAAYIGYKSFRNRYAPIAHTQAARGSIGPYQSVRNPIFSIY